MRIIVDTTNDKNIHITLPTGLILNRLTALIAAKAAQKNGIMVTYEQIYSLLTALKDFKRINGDWTLVEVESADGNYVKITI